MFSDSEDDVCIFVCGMCKHYFTQLSVFVQHKKERLCQQRSSEEILSENNALENHIDDSPEDIETGENADILDSEDAADYPNDHFMSTEALASLKIGGNFTISNCKMNEESLLTTLTVNGNDSKHRMIAYKTIQDLTIRKYYKDRVSLQSSGFLMLRNVTVKDSGVYKCTRQMENGTRFHYETRLYVGVAPVIEPFLQSSISLLEGDQLKVICKVSGIPSPNVFWYKNNVHSLRGIKIGTGNILQMRNLLPSNSGTYYCHACNRMGDAERVLSIEVYERPKVREFIHSGALDNTTSECDGLRFMCLAGDTIPPVTVYHFYRNGHLIDDSKTGEFTIPVVRKKDHEGRYSCVPENKFGVGLHSSIDIKVIVAPYECKETPSKSRLPGDYPTTIFTTAFSGRDLVPSDAMKNASQKNAGNQLHLKYFMIAVVSILYAIRTT